MLDGLLILLLFQFLGELIVTVTGLPLPAPVVGMVLLLLALLLNAPFSQRVAKAAGTLIQYIGLLIFPLGVGIVLQWHRYQEHALALILVVVVGTLISMVGVALLFKWLLQPGRERSGD